MAITFILKFVFSHHMNPVVIVLNSQHVFAANVSDENACFTEVFKWLICA